MSEPASRNGWHTYRFDEMATMVNDRIDDPSAAGVEYYVGLEHLDSESLTIRRWGVPSDVEATKLRFRAGDIIFGRRRVYQRKLAVADFDGICSAHAMVLRAKPAVALPDFLPLFMQSDLFMERAKEISVGSLSPTINWKTLASEEFALPPLEEQRRISKALLAIDNARGALTESQERLGDVRRSHLDDFFEPRLTDGAPLTEVARVIAGGTPPKANPALWNGGRPWASGKDLKARSLNETAETLTDEGWALATVAPRGATLIVVRGMILAHTFPVARCERDIAFNQDLRALVARGQLEAAYLFLWAEWAAPWFLARTAASSHGTKRLEGHIFDQALVPVPSRSEQLRFVEQHEAFVHAETVLQLRMESLWALRRSFARAELERRP
jgi:type I restriction enzyme S subunit